MRRIFEIRIRNPRCSRAWRVVRCEHIYSEKKICIVVAQTACLFSHPSPLALHDAVLLLRFLIFIYWCNFLNIPSRNQMQIKLNGPICPFIFLDVPFGWTMNIWKWGCLCPDSGQLLFSKPHHDNTYFHFKMGPCDVSCKLIVRENKNELMRYSFIWTACGVRVEESFHGLFMMRVFFSLCEHTHTHTNKIISHLGNWIFIFIFLHCVFAFIIYTSAKWME